MSPPLEPEEINPRNDHNDNPSQPPPPLLEQIMQPAAAKVSPPITLLQEICSRNGLTPDYQLLSTEGSVHEPTFKICVNVGDISAIASGQSKKKARHAAARGAIDKLRQDSKLNFDGINFDLLAPLDAPSTKSVYEAAITEPNPVGKLQEICMKMRVNPPDYDTCDEKGLAHEREFYLSCSIISLKLNTLGRGRSKKLAKRQAAELMLTQLENAGMLEKTSSNKKPEQGTESLHMDVDDDTHFIRARRMITEFINHLGCTTSELWKDIEMIEQDDVNEDIAYTLFQETISSAGHWTIEQMTDRHCVVLVYNHDNVVVLASPGFGPDLVSAMRDAFLTAYKTLISLIQPLTKTDFHQPHREAGTVHRQATCPET